MSAVNPPPDVLAAREAFARRAAAFDADIERVMQALAEFAAAARAAARAAHGLPEDVP